MSIGRSAPKKKDPDRGPEYNGSDDRLRCIRMHMHEFSEAASILKFHDSRDLGKQRIVATDAHIQPGFKLGSALPHKDCSTVYELSGKTLHSKSLGLAVSSVSGASHSLFVCHNDLLTCHIDLFDTDFGMLLAVPTCTAVLLFLFIFEHEDRIILVLGL